MSKLANRLKELRLDKGMTQSQLGKLLCVSQDTVSLWEKGKSLPSVDIVIELCKLYDVSSDYILCLKDY